MKIYIPTRGRQKNQITLSNLPASYLKDTYLVVPHGETGHLYDRVIHTPEHIDGIAVTRQWLLEGKAHTYEKIIMLDDDLMFNIRIEGTTKLRKPTENDELIPMFEAVLDSLDDHALVSVSPRQGNNRCEEEFWLATKSTRFLGINRSKVTTERFDRTTVMDDYDFTLQLLRNGKVNKVFFNYSQDQPASNAMGGASLYRTKDILKQNAERLAALHPGFVKVVEKETKSSWFGDGKRTDVTIYWKKAFKSSEQKLVPNTAGEDIVGKLPWRTV